MVTKQEFKEELLNDTEMLKDGGTDYRQQTAELSIQVFNNVHDISKFFNREDTLEIVEELLKDANYERQKDVAKMLNVIYVQMATRQNYSEDFKRELTERKTDWNRMYLELKNK